MASLNRHEIIGRLGKDPEIKYTTSGKAVANFSVATSETWKDQDGNKQEKTQWHRITIWGKLANICDQYLHKGDLVYLAGKVEHRQYEDANGATKYITETVCNEMVMLGGKPTSDSGAARPAQSQRTSQGDNPYQETVNF
jgi:single-strand DNA-binding protein